MHDIARVLPKHSRDDFLNRLKKCISDKEIDSSHIWNEYTEEDRNNYESIKDKLTKIENWEICLSGTNDFNRE